MEKSFSRDLSALDGIFEFVGEFLDQIRSGESVEYTVCLAVEEIFTNIVKYSKSSSNDVSISLMLDDNRVVLRLVDKNSDCFDITAVKDTDVTVPIQKRAVGGLGLHLVRQMADAMEYDYENGNSVVTVTKKLES